MRLRTLLAATVTSALAVGVAGAPALATRAPDPAGAGMLTTWGFTANPNAGPAIAIPGDLTGPVLSVAATNKATGVVTLDGRVRVWGAATADEANEVPSGITDAAAISLSLNHGAVLHNDGRVTGWGAPDGPDPAALSNVPTNLRARAIALQVGTGFAVTTNGTLTTWGDEPPFPAPAGAAGWTDLVDVSASTTQIMVLHADGTVDEWGYDNPEEAPGLLDVPDFGGKKAVKIATGGLLSGVIFEDGTIDIWGSGVPAGEPTFDGQTPAGKVVSLGMWANVAAVTADGAVHAWGTFPQVNNVPGGLAGKPVSAVAVGNFHAAAVATVFRDVTKPVIAGQPDLGQILTATPATFSLTPDNPATGQWYAGEDAIEGQTGTTLTLDASLLGKQISYRTTATRDGETVTSTSDGVGPVSLATSTTTLTISPAQGAVGTARTVTATVTATSGTPTGTVTFTTGGTTATRPLSGSKATWTLPALAVGNHTVTAKYSGDDNTKPSTSAATTVRVAKAGAKVSAKAKVIGKTKKVAKKVTITVTVKTSKGVSPAGKVTVILKGKTKKSVSAKVNAKGKATVTVRKVKRGKYQATVKYAGNASVSAGAGQVKFKV